MPLLPSAGGYNPSPNNGGVTGSPQGGGGGITDTLLNLVDPAGIRNKISGLLPGGVTSLFNKSAPPGINITDSSGQSNPSNPIGKDWRVRVGLFDWSPFANNKMFAPLLTKTNGVVFPYTPSISVTHNARYAEQALTHSNYKNYFYEGSDVAAITVSGDFTVQNHDDAIYLLSTIYFFRTCTKMFFGDDALAGNPPPIVSLNGYGDFYFPNVPCILTSFQHTMPSDVDYVEFYYTGESPSQDLGGGVISTASQQLARLPTTSQISITLQPVYSRKNVHDNMTLTEFSQGHLLGKGFI